MSELLNNEDERVTVIAQIEDREGIEHFEEIANVLGVDATFVGVADLAVCLNANSPSDPVVMAIVDKVTTCLSIKGKACGAFLSDAAGVHAHGASFWIIGSDQSVLKAGWRQTVDAFRQTLK